MQIIWVWKGSLPLHSRRMAFGEKSIIFLSMRPLFKKIGFSCYNSLNQLGFPQYQSYGLIFAGWWLGILVCGFIFYDSSEYRLGCLWNTFRDTCIESNIPLSVGIIFIGGLVCYQVEMVYPTMLKHELSVFVHPVYEFEALSIISRVTLFHVW